VSLYVDVVRYPDLFLNIFRRELHGKYRGSFLGVLWTLINPLALVAVYTIVFSVLLKAFQVDHYPLFVLSGLVTWVFFQSAIQMSCSSLFSQPNLVKQVRFPRHLLPLAVVGTNVVTLLAMLAVVLPVNLIALPETRTVFWAAIPVLVLLLALVAGFALIVAYVTVIYRDVEHLFITIFLPWFFLTPVFYNFDSLPGLQGREWLTSLLYWVNFVSPFVRAIRDPIFYGQLPRLIDVVYCCVVAFAMLLLGALVARRMDDQIAAQL
jgi:ABC-type polysaccharide/polyol phosphate export permease